MFRETRREKKKFQGPDSSWWKHARGEKRFINRRFRRWKKLNLHRLILEKESQRD